MVKGKFKNPATGGYIWIEGNDKQEVLDQYNSMVRASQQPEGDRQFSAVETATDIAKSIPASVLKGASHIPGLPGNIEMLGRMGINYLGGEGTVDAETALPTGNDIYEKGVKGVAKDLGVDEYLHDPETTGGRYADAIIQGVTGAAGTGGIGGLVSGGVRGGTLAAARAGAAAGARNASNIAAGAGGAVASQAAVDADLGVGGQLAAGLAGGVLAGRVVSPLTMGETSKAAMQAATKAAKTGLIDGNEINNYAQRVDRLMKKGVFLRMGDRIDSWRRAEDALDEVLFNKAGRAKVRKQQATLTEVAIKEAGLDKLNGRNWDKVTPRFMDTARKHFSDRYDMLDQSMARLTISQAPRFWNRLSQDLTEYSDFNIQRHNLPPRLRNLLDDLDARADPTNPRFNQPIMGDELVRWTQNLRQMAKAYNTDEGRFAASLRANLMDAMAEGQPVGSVANTWVKDLRAVNADYRKFKVIQKANSFKSSHGDYLDANALDTAGQRVLGREYETAPPGSFGEFINDVGAVIKSTSNSGTTERSNVVTGVGKTSRALQAPINQAFLGAPAAATMMGITDVATAGAGMIGAGITANALSAVTPRWGGNRIMANAPVFNRTLSAPGVWNNVNALQQRAIRPAATGVQIQEQRQKQTNDLMMKSKVWDRK